MSQVCFKGSIDIPDQIPHQTLTLSPVRYFNVYKRFSNCRHTVIDQLSKNKKTEMSCVVDCSKVAIRKNGYRQ